jgi:nucleoside 2-deoxyribosyltransferase
MKLYLAGAYAARDVLRDRVVPMLESVGHEVTSGWLQGSRPISPLTIGTSPISTDAEVADFVRGDLQDILNADALVLMTGNAMMGLDRNLDPLQLHTGGRHFETGFAHALGVPVVVVGQPENVFHRALATRTSYAGLLTTLRDLSRATVDRHTDH